MKSQINKGGRNPRISALSAILSLCLVGAWLAGVVPSKPGIEYLPGGLLSVRAETDAAHASTGEIHGIVRIQSRIQPKSMAISIYSRRSGSSVVASAPSPTNELENVVLYLEKDPRLGVSTFDESQTADATLLGTHASARGQPHPSIRQINETFLPHVLPILTGTTVEFPNGDPFFHNVFSLSSAKSFDLGRYPQGQARWVRFDKPGIVKIFCHIHSHMSAVVLVFDHPYFTVPSPKGEFVLGPVPQGNYTLVGWHERLKPVRKPITIGGNETSAVNLVL